MKAKTFAVVFATLMTSGSAGLAFFGLCIAPTCPMPWIFTAGAVAWGAMACDLSK